ncbi:MAG TPA: type II secretion system protein [Gemmatimonadaceae bacterium]|jgi:prepilin-type N-terminal cleavage/methylation domain-containing protein
MMRPLRARRGFTLIEMTIAMVIVAIIGASLTKIMMSQMRYFQMQSAQKSARSISRGTLNLLTKELRMLEATGGVVSATNAKLVVNVPYAFGIACTGSTVSLLPVDSLTYAQAKIGGYAWKDTSAAGAYTYVATTTAPGAGTATTCSTAPVSISTVTNGKVITLSPAPPAGAVTGSPVFLYETITYEFKASTAVSGATALWRTVTGGSANELAAPFDTSARFRYYSLDSPTSQITPPAAANIRGIDLQLDALSETQVAGRPAPEASKIRTSVFFRNRIQ